MVNNVPQGMMIRLFRGLVRATMTAKSYHDRGDLSGTGERSEQSRITSPVKPFLVIVLPSVLSRTNAGHLAAKS
jgi:hypothetical protein